MVSYGDVLNIPTSSNDTAWLAPAVLSNSTTFLGSALCLLEALHLSEMVCFSERLCNKGPEEGKGLH